jgi:polar amino acid transport system substrate-binding protein
MQAEKNGTIKVLRLPSDIQSFSMLMAKRADAVPSDVEVGYVLLRQLYGDKVSLFTHDSAHYIGKSDYRLAVSKKIKNGPALLEKFNDGLAQLRKSGRYDEILKTWYNRPVYKEAVPADYLTRPPVKSAAKSVKR